MAACYRKSIGSRVGVNMEGQAKNQKAGPLRVISEGTMYVFPINGVEFYVNEVPRTGVVRIMGDGLVQGFDNVEEKPLREFCEQSLRERDLHLRALDRMDNEVDRKTLLEDLKANRKDMGLILTNRLIRFVESSTCRSPELLRKLKLQVGLQNYEVLKRLHFEIENPRFKKSLDVFYTFCKLMGEWKSETNDMEL